jgi:hypothetical protein
MESTSTSPSRTTSRVNVIVDDKAAGGDDGHAQAGLEHRVGVVDIEPRLAAALMIRHKSSSAARDRRRRPDP